MKVLNKIPPALSIEPKEVIEGLVNKTFIVDGVETLQLSPVEDVTEGVKASDFGLHQLITAGATELLKPCPKMNDNRVDVADNVENIVESFIPEYEKEVEPKNL